MFSLTMPLILITAYYIASNNRSHNILDMGYYWVAGWHHCPFVLWIRPLFEINALPPLLHFQTRESTVCVILMHKPSAFKCILALFHHPTQFFTHPKSTIGKYCIYRVIIHYALLHLWQHCTTQLYVWPCGKKRVKARWCEAGHGGS